jgi:hypothetical protein
MNPKIHLYTLCYNEEKIIPYFYRHYRRFVDKITVFDNYSTDFSVKILKGYPGVKVNKYDTNNQINDKTWIDMKNNFWKESRGKADFIIVCDLDEILYYQDIQILLRKLKKYDYTIVKPIGYNMISKYFPTCKNDIYQEVKYGVRAEHMDKLILFNPNEIDEIDYNYGCHQASPKGNVKIYKDDKNLKLLHFKDLSEEYIINKYKRNKKRLSSFNKKSGCSRHYSFSEKKLCDYYKKAYKDKIKVI